MGGGGNTRKFSFADVGGEGYKLFLKFNLWENLDNAFGAGANNDFYRILQMSRAEYAAKGFDKKEVIVDLVEN